MAKIFMIGNSHLKHCHDLAVKSNKSLNFGCSGLTVFWDSGHENIKNLEKVYRDATLKNGQPDAVFIMCGGYELMLTNDSKSVVNRLKTLIQHITSGDVKHIIVCSILDRRCGTIKEEESVNKVIRQTNKMLAKAFKDLTNVSFINVRPPGNVKLIIDEDKYHLKEQFYDHVFKRLSTILQERILPHLPTVVPKGDKSNDEQAMDVAASSKPSVTPQKDVEHSMDKRLADFKNTLVNDYKRYCSEEKALSAEFERIQRKLDKTVAEKNEVGNVFKKLFGVDLGEDSLNKV